MTSHRKPVTPSVPSTASVCLPTTRASDAEWRLLEAALREAFARNGEISPDHEASKILSSANAERLVKELRFQARHEGGCYTRTTLLQTEHFCVLLLCWAPGISSPVHAHSDAESGTRSNCFMRVLEGKLMETRYEQDAIDGERVYSREGRQTLLDTGSYAYINDEQGVHKVGNASASEVAISLHVYAPGWQTVQLYEESADLREAETDASGVSFDIDGWGDF